MGVGPGFEGSETRGVGWGRGQKNPLFHLPSSRKHTRSTSGPSSNSPGPAPSEGASRRSSVGAPGPATRAPHPQDVLPSARSPSPSQAASTPPRVGPGLSGLLPPHLPARSRGPAGAEDHEIPRPAETHQLPRQGEAQSVGQGSQGRVPGACDPLAALSLWSRVLRRGGPSLSQWGTGSPMAPSLTGNQSCSRVRKALSGKALDLLLASLPA